MDKFKFTEAERGELEGYSGRQISELRFGGLDNILDRIETIISSRADSVLSSLPAPTQDGTAEEFMDQWSNHNSWRSKGGIHKMITAYAAPLRAEIERLKSELAASVSPKLVMPERKEFNRFGDHLDDMHVQTWNMVLDELRRLNPSILK